MAARLSPDSSLMHARTVERPSIASSAQPTRCLTSPGVSGHISEPQHGMVQRPLPSTSAQSPDAQSSSRAHGSK